MKSLISSFTNQLREAIAIGSSFKTGGFSPIQNVVISGLGGSGIGGSIVSELMDKEAAVPITVVKDYTLPGFVNEKTLLIISSYSGDTEETTSAMDDGLAKKAQVVCITSGGKVASKAKELNLPFIIIPGGMPPRACLAYSFTQLLFVLENYKIIGSGFRKSLANMIDQLDKEEETIKKSAQEIANKIKGKIPVIYTTAPFNSVAVRFRQQLNENSKQLAWNNIFPEMNHNELVGWSESHQELAVIFLRHKDEFYRTSKRIEISKPIISKHCNTLVEIEGKGNDEIEKAIYFIHFCDWVSLFLAEVKGVDPIEIGVINHLKAELSKI